MRTASDNYRSTIRSGGFALSYEADLFYDGRRLFESLPIVDPSWTFDGSSPVLMSGSCTVQWNDAHGTSLSPSDPQDWLAPYGSSLTVYAVVAAGAFRERIQLGVLDITAIPSANDDYFVLGESRVVIGSTVKVELKDRMVEVQRDRFTRASAPTVLTSAWGEAAALTGFALSRSLPDVPVTNQSPYGDDRVEALGTILSLLGGVPFMASDGTLSARPTAPGPVVGALTVGANGTITEVGAALDADGVYNGVIIRAETGDQEQVLAELWVTSGPLRATPAGGPRTPFHRVPRFYSSPQLDTAEKAAAAAPGLLAQFSQPRASELNVQCIIDPTIEVGDVLTAVDQKDAVWTIRVTKITLGASATMSITGDVLSRDFR
jgi:hypothetical protein